MDKLTPTPDKRFEDEDEDKDKLLFFLLVNDSTSRMNYIITQGQLS